MSENKTDQRKVLPSERVIQVCLMLFAAIALFGGCLQMYLGEPDTTPRLDNVHRFMAGVYLTCGIISLWTALTVRKQNTLIFLVALGGLLGATGRLVSMKMVGLPEPHTLWLTYLLSELIIPLIIIGAQLLRTKKLKSMQ